MPPSTPGQRTPCQQNTYNESSFRMSPRNVKFEFDSKSSDCLQLCIDVPFQDHPYLIGPRGRKSQYFMTRYKSLIHFPDTNCRTDGVKLNNVLISGKMKSVEEIRAQMRLRTPVRILVQLRQFQQREKLVCRIENAIAERHVPIRFTYSDDYLTCSLKTEWRNEKMLVQFCEEFFTPGHLMKSAEPAELFTLAIALLPLINPFNKELSHRLAGQLYEQTGCRVFFPPREKFSVEPPVYFVKGSTVAGLLQAGKQLIVGSAIFRFIDRIICGLHKVICVLQGLTMLQISFRLPPGIVPTAEQELLNDWQKDLLVHTTIFSPPPGETQFSVTLRSFEFCVNGLYAVRSALLGFRNSVQTTSYEHMKFVKYLIPYTVFSEAKLYYALYSVDDKSLTWAPDEFFDHFYGGPYTIVAPPIRPLQHQNIVPLFQQQQFNDGGAGLSEESELEQQHPVELAPASKQYTLSDFRFVHVPVGPAAHHPLHSLMPPLLDPNNNSAGAQSPPQFVFFHAIDPNNNIGHGGQHDSSGCSSSTSLLLHNSSDLLFQ